MGSVPSRLGDPLLRCSEGRSRLVVSSGIHDKSSSLQERSVCAIRVPKRSTRSKRTAWFDEPHTK